MEEGFSKYDPTEYLTSEAEIKAYLDEAVEVGDPELISAVLDDIAKVRSTKEPSQNGRDLGEIE
ncbi:DNA-binding protein [Aeromonas bestiarum]|uniref:helix-turn-helix domain-containing transcriptional regulator n=1 Tax=Aeromonas bestiarum TaxID=105751 RepID=UPI0032B10434